MLAAKRCPTRRGARACGRRGWAVLGLAVALTSARWAPAADPGPVWTPLCDFDTTVRVWSSEAGPTPCVTVSSTQAFSGRRSLAVTFIVIREGRSIRQTWQTAVDDLGWSADSRLRFRIRGDPAARNPHGGVLLVEAGGRRGGGDSHWLLPIAGEVYASPDWQLVTTVPVREATNPDWAPDTDGRPDPARISRLLFVAQQEAPVAESRPFTFYLDDLEASAVRPLAATYRPAEVEGKPDHVTPIWRGFTGRQREHAAQVAFDDLAGWRVAQIGGSEARLLRSEEEPCYEDLRYQAKIVYRSADGSGHIELLPPQPIALPARFNAVGAWVYGNNWSWVPDPATPPVTLRLRLLDAAGQRHQLELGTVNFRFYGWLTKRLHATPEDDPRHLFWGGPADGRVQPPAVLESIEMDGGLQSEPRTIYLESLAFYQDDMPLPAFRPGLLDRLPFPTTPDTILPGVATPTRTTVAVDGRSYVLSASGDEEIVWRYTPATGTLSDLTVQVAGRPPVTPCAGAGPVLLAGGREFGPAAAEVSRELVDVRLAGDAVVTRWRVTAAGQTATLDLSLRAQAKSAIVDWASPDPVWAGLELGRVAGLAEARLVRVPYLSIHGDGPAVAFGNHTAVATFLDWYRTGSSGFHSRTGLDAGEVTVNGGCSYFRLTDGTRNPLVERQFINVSSRFDEVLPTIPNPPSTQAAVTRTHLYTHLGGTAPNRFQVWLDMWREYHRLGIRNVLVTHHEDAWTNGADVGQGGQEYTMCTEAAPEVGDAALQAYCRAMRDLGYSVGLYENFTDYNPLGRSWDERNALRDSAGELVRVWPPTYAIRPLKALDMARDYPRRVAAKFGTNTAYRDCHTAYPPWGQVDYQAGAPGAGRMLASFQAWGALLRDGSRAYGGPIFSEGGHHWFSAGLVDGNYAQITMPGAAEYPLLLDFDLRRIHPLEADISMTPGWAWGPGGFWGGLALTIAYGHMGFQPFGNTAEAARYYYLIQQLQSRYVMVPATEIAYHDRGRFLDITAAVEADVLARNQVRVRYAGGLEVAVNANPQERWQATVGGRQHDLSGNGWAAAAPGFVEYCTEIGGRRVGYVDSPAYRFADGGGREFEFGPLATDGAVVLLPDADGGQRLILLTETRSLYLDLPADACVDAFDRADQPVPATVTRGPDGRSSLATAGVDHYRIRTRKAP